MGKQPRTKATMPFYFLYLSSNCNQKTGDRIAAISRLVPGAGKFSNTLLANLHVLLMSGHTTVGGHYAVVHPSNQCFHLYV